MFDFRLILALSAVLLVWAPALPAAAESDPEASEEMTAEQKENFVEFVKAGKEAYSAGNFEEAIPFLEKAYDIAPKPELHYRIALCHERAGHPREAIEFYEKFLQARPDSEKRGQIETTVARLKEEISETTTARLRVTSSPAGAKLYIGDANEPEGTTPIEFESEPGSVVIRLEKQGRQSVSERVDLEAGKNYQLSYSLSKLQQEPSGTAEKSGVNSGAMVAGIAGGAAAATGGTFAGIALHCKANTDKNACKRSLYNTSRTAAWIGGGVGLAGLGTAAILLLSDNSRSRSASRRVRLLVGPRALILAGPLPDVH